MPSFLHEWAPTCLDALVHRVPIPIDTMAYRQLAASIAWCVAFETPSFLDTDTTRFQAFKALCKTRSVDALVCRHICRKASSRSLDQAALIPRRLVRLAYRPLGRVRSRSIPSGSPAAESGGSEVSKTPQAGVGVDSARLESAFRRRGKHRLDPLASRSLGALVPWFRACSKHWSQCFSWSLVDWHIGL